MLSRAGERLWRATRQDVPWSNALGLARTLIATSTLGTLALSPADAIFRPAVGSPEVPRCTDIPLPSYFCIDGLPLEALRWIAVAFLALVASGWRPRLTAVPHAWISWSLMASGVMVDGGDQAAANLSVLLLPVALTDDRKWHWEVRPQVALQRSEAVKLGIAYPALWAVRGQIAWIYLESAIGKMFVPEWMDGTAVYDWFNHPGFGAAPGLSPIVEAITHNGVVVALGSWGTIILEFFLGIALLLRRSWQRVLFPLGLMLHFGIFLVIGLTSFVLVMFGALLIYIGPRDLREAVEWGRRLRVSLAQPMSNITTQRSEA